MSITQTRKKKIRSFSGNKVSNYSPNRRNKKSNKKAATGIDPSRLIKKAIKTEEAVFIPSQSFSQMAIHAKLKANLAKKGFTNPTQIQENAIGHLIEGRNLLGVANTGTGKTGAFLIPIIEQLLNNHTAPFKSLVVVPTRELALQVEEEFRSLTKGLGLYAASFIGGTNIGSDLGRLRRQNHLIIGTPGRLMDLAGRGALRLEGISTLVLDEFDRMLDMGFVNDIKKMVKAMGRRKQTMLFSATIDPTQKSLINQLLNNPVEVKVSSGTSTSDHIEQDIIKVPEGEDKFKMLLDLINDDAFEKVLIFAETKRLVNKVSKRLNQSGVKTDLIHGNKSQNYRNNALDKFKRGKVQVLVATDVAARGIDVSNVTHVINYQLPKTYDSYVHRIGRTGRGGNVGKAFTFIN